LQGPVFGDAQGMDDVSGSGMGDASIRAAIDRFAVAGFAAMLDMRMETWTQPKSGVGDQAAGLSISGGIACEISTTYLENRGWLADPLPGTLPAWKPLTCGIRMSQGGA
jgi:hypothetical protein